MLLIKIDALQDPKWGGCWASNAWLGNWWSKSVVWVSNTVSKLQKLGLVETSQVGHGKRIIKTIYPLNKTLRGVEENFNAPLKKTLTKVPYGKERVGPPSGRGSLVDTFGIEGHPQQVREFSAGVRLYADFSKRRGFHVTRLNGEVRYAKGGQEGGWSRPVLEKWEKVWQDLCSRHGREKAQQVLTWFLKNYDLEFVPVAQTLPTFASKWDQIEKSMRREQLKAQQRNGDDPEPDEDQEQQTPRRSYEDMSPEEQKEFDEDMRKIQFPTGEE